MAIIDIEVEDVGVTGLIWLFLSYGFILFYASNLISEGSDLLLLVPSWAGLVGGVVLPFLGAVPDGAIMLFSGLGSLESAQETLSVGVGALAGSTIMLLTIPFGASVIMGRVDIVDGECRYKKPKLTAGRAFSVEIQETGVSISPEVRESAIIMMITTATYFFIQVPAFFFSSNANIAVEETYYALATLCLCLVGFGAYLARMAQQALAGNRRQVSIEIMKQELRTGKISLSGALEDVIKTYDTGFTEAQNAGNLEEYKQISDLYPPQVVKEYLEGVLKDSFNKYDKNRDDGLQKSEFVIFLRDINESVEDADVDALFEKYDANNSGEISFDEFIGACYSIVKKAMTQSGEARQATQETESLAVADAEEEEEEEEEVPDDIAHLSPEEQQWAIKKRAFIMLTYGTALVLLLSDPMVDVLVEIADRIGISAFYVSFVLTPLASNASEVIASTYYSAKKTSSSISISISALQGAASMNNTFCLGIFMALIYFRGLAWSYSAETISIVLIQYIIGSFSLRKNITYAQGIFILSLYLLSIFFVAILEAFGLD